MYYYDPYFITTWYKKKFAFIPTKLYNGRYIWFKSYYNKITGGIFAGYSDSLDIKRLSVSEYMYVKYKEDPNGFFNKEMENL